MIEVEEAYEGHIHLTIELRPLLTHLLHKINDLGYSCDWVQLSNKVLHEYNLIPVTKNDTDQSE
jgi:hypothetical protein